MVVRTPTNGCPGACFHRVRTKSFLFSYCLKWWLVILYGSCFDPRPLLPSFFQHFGHRSIVLPVLFARDLTDFFLLSLLPQVVASDPLDHVLILGLFYRHSLSISANVLSLSLRLVYVRSL